MNAFLVTIATAFPIAGGFIFVREALRQALDGSSAAMEAHALVNVAASLKRAPAGWHLMWE